MIGTSTSARSNLSRLVYLSLSIACYLRCFLDYIGFLGVSIDYMQNYFSRSKYFPLIRWILRYTLFHGFDTLSSHLREEGSLDYDGGLVCLQVQTNFDAIINHQQRRRRAGGVAATVGRMRALWICLARSRIWAAWVTVFNETTGVPLTALCSIWNFMGIKVNICGKFWAARARFAWWH
jgi:hypothetical protein